MAPEGASGNPPLHVLVVDDDSSTLRLISSLLSSRGLQTVLARSPHEAQEILEARGTDGLDCALVDYRMPGMNGLELLDWLFKKDATLSTILMTAEGDIELVTGALRHGVTDYVEKPFNIPQLFESLKTAGTRTAERRYLKLAVDEVKDITAIHERLVPDTEIVAPPFAKDWAPKLETAFHPAHETGGDFINCFTMPGNRLLLVAGDVSGHDLKAGFVAAYFQGICRGMIAMDADLETVRAYFNDFLCHQWNRRPGEKRTRDLITSLAVCFVLVDFDRMTLACLNNGFPSPHLCPEDLDVQQMAAHGPPLGWFAEPETFTQEHPLPAAGSLTLCSDGLGDIANAMGIHEHSFVTRLLDASPKGRAELLEDRDDDVLIVRLCWNHRDSTHPKPPLLVFSKSYPGRATDKVDEFQSEWENALTANFPELDDDQQQEILLCCREAILNAMQHGSSGQPDSRCRITIARVDNAIQVRVDDEGAGYQNTPAPVPAPGAHVSLGLRIIASYAHRMWTKRSGASLFMEFNTPTEGAA